MTDSGPSHGYGATRRELLRRLGEPAPGKIQILTGPRQVGKTTLLLDIARRRHRSAAYCAADSPEAAFPGWWELQWENALRAAGRGKFLLLVDEVHYLQNWSRLIKSAADQIARLRLPLQIVISGSASLVLGSGARESMAGRFERLILRQWTSRDLASAFGMSPAAAVLTYARFGSFPGSVQFLGDLPRWRSYVRESIVEPAVGRDLLMLEAVRKPGLLRQVFAVSVGHPAEILSLAKIAGNLTETGTLETIAHYLHVLEQAYLISPLQKHSQAEVRRRASPPKLIPMSNAFLSLVDLPPDPVRERNRWGRWLENACLAFAVSSGQNVRYWREDPREVDAVVTGSWGKLALEVKYGRFGMRDLAGLLEFHRRWPEYRPLVIGEEEHLDGAQGSGIAAVSWQKFLWDGPAGLDR
jgi:uncharacterized protein